MSLTTFLIILAGVLLNAVAQLLLKAGIGTGAIFESSKGLFDLVFGVLFQKQIFLGLSCYVFSVAIWIVALSRAPVSTAYPLLSIGYVVNLFFAYWFFGEPVTAYKLLGIFLIIIGVFFISR